MNLPKACRFWFNSMGGRALAGPGARWVIHRLGHSLPFGARLNEAVVISQLLAFVIGLAGGTCAADTVVYRTGEDGSGRATATGTIEELAGGILVLLRESGVRQSIPESRVLRLESDWSAMHEAGDRLMEAGEFDEAARSYRAAIAGEPRSWVKRKIVAGLIQCNKNLGQSQQAGVAFLELLRSDPKTHYFHLIPLSWRPYQPDRNLQGQAEDWLRADSSPVAVLMGASWLLSTGRRGDAIESLRQLTAERDSRVAFLSQAQLWRTLTATATVSDVETWQAMVGRMPTRLRGGPYFVVGRAWGAQGRHELAALSFLRVPILYPAERQLAAWALLSAGGELEKIEQTKEAVSIYKEIVRDHPEHEAVAEARALLDRLSGS